MEAIYSKMHKGPVRTYFVDVRQARNGARVLTISETSLSDSGDKKYKRVSITIFQNEAGALADTINEAMNLMKKG